MRARWLPLLLFVAVPLARGTFPPPSAPLDLATARLFFSNALCTDYPDHCRRATGLKPGTDFDAYLAHAPDRARIVNAFLQTFDAHARLETGAPAGLYREFNGLGFDQELSDVGSVIRRVYPGTPASRSLRPGDRLLEIDGLAVEGERALRALARLSRAPGEKVSLLIERGGVTRHLTLPIARLRLSSVNIESLGSGLARIELRQFNTGVCAEIRAKLPPSTSRVLLDLRNNPGGSVPEAECVHGLFATGRMVERRAIAPLIPFAESRAATPVVPAPTGEFKNVRLVVLVNAFSASAAEMLAAALQDAGRAWVVGEATFGKGTTQAQARLGDARFVFTVSRYYRPAGQPLQRVGVTPNFRVAFAVGEEDRRFPREGDLFPEALPREDAPAWRETRPRAAARVRSCAEPRGESADRQAAFALGVLDCT